MKNSFTRESSNTDQSWGNINRYLIFFTLTCKREKSYTLDVLNQKHSVVITLVCSLSNPRTHWTPRFKHTRREEILIQTLKLETRILEKSSP